MSNELTVSDIRQAAAIMSSSNLFGKKENELAALMLIAQAEGKPVATAALEYDIIQGKPALKSQSAQARFQLAGGKIEWKVSNETECIAVFSHPSGGTLEIKWDLKRAEKAGLLHKDTWKKYPAQLLRARCVAEGVRAVNPACLNQIYLVEEVQDFDDKPQRKPVETTHEVIGEEVNPNNGEVFTKEVRSTSKEKAVRMPTQEEFEKYNSMMECLTDEGFKVDEYLVSKGLIAEKETYLSIKPNLIGAIINSPKKFKAMVEDFTNNIYNAPTAQEAEVVNA